MYVKDQILTLQAYTPGKPTEAVMKEHGLEKVVKLASNENPFGCSEKAMEALLSLQGKFAIYPDGDSIVLREKVASFLGVKPRQLLFGSGADEVIQMLSRALLTPTHNIVQATPTFSQYSHHAVIEGAEVRNVPLVNGTHDLDAMLDAIDENTKIVWVCNPNNPTGTYVNTEQLEVFLAKVPSSVFVVIDEAYYEYAVAEDYPQTLPLLDKYDNVIVLRTFSKAYGLASFRVGYGVASETLMEEINIARLPFNTSMAAQVVATAVLDDQAFIEKCVTENRNGLAKYVAFCEEHGIKYYPSQANFIYMEVNNSRELFAQLEKKGYIVRAFPAGIRITIGTEEENEGLLKELEEVWRQQAVQRG
ncbi:MAG: histidinol-phosphate transaminase [Bacillaceae bacterium]